MLEFMRKMGEQKVCEKIEYYLGIELLSLLTKTDKTQKERFSVLLYTIVSSYPMIMANRKLFS